MKILIYMVLFLTYGLSHPVSYTIDLTAKYDEKNKLVKITCISSSRNKCGTHSFHLFDKKDVLIKTSRFPFLKNKKILKLKRKPHKMVFFLKKVPEHQYIVYFNEK